MTELDPWAQLFGPVVLAILAMVGIDMGAAWLMRGDRETGRALDER